MQFFKKTSEFDFMTRRKFFLAISGIVVLLCLIAIFGVGPKFGIDFMGGTEIQVNFKEKVDSAQIRETLAKLGFVGSDVQTFGAHESEYLMRLQAISAVSDEQAKASEASVSKALTVGLWAIAALPEVHRPPKDSGGKAPVAAS